MHCPQCQAVGGPEDAYCIHCGCQLSPASPEVARPESPPYDGRSTWDPPWRSGQVALGILVIIAVVTPVLLLASVLADWVGRDPLAVQASVSSIAMGVVILAAVWVLARNGAGRPLPALGFGSPRVSPLAAGLLVIPVLAVNLGFTALYAATVRWASAEPLVPPELGPEIAFSGPAVIISFAALAVWTPVTEEVFFRGFVLSGILHRLGRWGAIAVSAAIFSAFHLDPGVLVPVFVTGFLLGWLYQRTGSIWPGIAVHAAQNSLALTGAILGV